MGRCGRLRRGGIGGGRGGALPAGAARRTSAAHSAFALCIPLAVVLAAAAVASAGLIAAPLPPAWAAAGGGSDGGGAPAPAATHVAVPQGTVLGAGSPAPAPASSRLAPGAAAANSTHMFVVDAGNGSGGGGRVLAFEIGPGPAGLGTLEAVVAVQGTPHGIAVNGTGHLFVSDPASGSVAVIGPGGERAGELRVPESARAAGAGAGTMDWPAGAAAAPDGRVYVAERNAGRVIVFGAGGEYLESIPRAGSAVRLLAPHGVAVGAASGEVYVADAAADAVHVFGAGGEHARRIDIPPLDGARGSPHGVAVDPGSGALYAASLLQGALHSYDSSGAPAGAPVQLSPRQGAAPDGALPPRLLSVAARGDGLLLVTDAANGRAVLAHPNGTVHSTVAGGAAGTPPFAPADAAAGAGGAAYAADAAAGTVSAHGPVPPSGARPHLWTSGSVPGPAGIAVDADAGRVLVAHRGGSGGVAVSMLSAGDGSPAGVLYEGGDPGRPAGAAVGPSGTAAIADPSAGSVRLVAADGAQIGRIAGLDDPVDAAFMSDGSLVVAERGAHAVRVFGAGSWEGGAQGGPAGTVASFGLGAGGVFMPEAVAVDGGDRIIVADAGGPAAFGPRVQVFDYAGRLVSQFDRDGGGTGGADPYGARHAAPYGAPYGLGAAPGGSILAAGAASGGGGGAVRTFASLDSEAPAVESFGMFGGDAAAPVPLAAGGAAHTLGPYSQIAANVTFTEPVVVRAAPPAAGGASAGLPPTLALGVAGGGEGRAPLASDEFCGPGNGTAAYGSGSGTASLLFSYTVLPGESAPALDYASERPLDSRGSSITDAAGNRADLSMPAAPGGPGSFSAAAAAAGGSVAVNGSAGAFVGIGLLAANATDADSRAAALAACDFNRERASARDPGAGAASAGPFLSLAAVEAPGALDVEASGGWADRRAALAIAALRESRGAGLGPAAYVTTLPDEVLATPVGPLQNSTVLGHAAGMGVVLAATAASSAPSPPAGHAGGETLYRLAPGGEHLAYALSAAIGPEIDVLFPIIQSDAFGEPAPARSGAAPFSHGLYGIVLGHLRDAGGIVNGFDAGALNYDRTRRAEFNFTAPHAGWAADAPDLDLNLALLKGQVGDNRVAVLYLGSAAEYVKIAEAAASAPGGLPSLSGTRWLAAGGVAASPLIEASPAAAALAASTGLDAVAFGVGGGGIGAGAAAGSSIEGYAATPAALRIDALVGPGQGGAARAYSAYDAVQVVGRAAALAAERAGGANGTNASSPSAPSATEISAHMGDAALVYAGALGNVRLDAATGYLGLPITYDVWRMDAETGAWLRAHAERGIDTCSMSLASPDLDFGPVKARAASDPVRQSMANTGTLDLARVALGPGEWDTGTGGAVPALPATLTEYVDELSAPAARFAAVSGDPSKPTLVARGLEPAAEAGLLLRLNLRAVQSLDGTGEMSQSIEYTASCDW